MPSFSPSKDIGREEELGLYGGEEALLSPEEMIGGDDAKDAVVRTHTPQNFVAG
ncbi:MAG: hypothetical protein ACUVUS_00025 [Thermoproteota archaeon]